MCLHRPHCAIIAMVSADQRIEIKRGAEVDVGSIVDHRL